MDGSKRDYQTGAGKYHNDFATLIRRWAAIAHDIYTRGDSHRKIPQAMFCELAPGVFSLIVTLTVGLLGTAIAQNATAPRIVEQSAFSVVGIEASSNRGKEEGPDAIVGKLWQQFTSQNLINRIPARVDPSIIAVYTDFSNDGHGEITLILGAKVQPVPNPVIPDGMVVKTVPAGRYAVFTTERGPAAKVVPETWKRIFAYFESPQNGQRAFQADYEVYDQRSADPNNVQVDIYVGLK